MVVAEYHQPGWPVVEHMKMVVAEYHQPGWPVVEHMNMEDIGTVEYMEIVE